MISAVEVSNRQLTDIVMINISLETNNFHDFMQYPKQKFFALTLSRPSYFWRYVDRGGRIPSPPPTPP